MTNPSDRRHILTVHLEDYFQTGPLSSAIPLRYWLRFDTRVERNLQATLDLLDACGHKATFFTVGWIADTLPDVVREVVRRGHEVASKGYLHRSIRQMSREEFRADAVKSRRVLEKAAGEAVRGYRIARGWFDERDLWALDVLAEEGFAYDSSLRHLGFVRRARGPAPFVHRSGNRTIHELPLPSWSLGGFSLPIAGGNYVRQFPDGFMRARITDFVARGEAPLNFYFHVWELDVDQPRISAVSARNRLRQYRNLEHMPERIGRYLKAYAFTTAADHLRLAPEPVAPVEAGTTSPDTSSTPAHGTARRPVTIVVPCFNEEASLGYLGRTLDTFARDNAATLEVSFVFVDDGSKDKTWQGLQTLFGSRPDCKIVRHSVNRGIAAACLTGIEAATTERVCVIDADCSFDPARLAVMIPMLEDGVDLVTASPYHRDGGVLNVPAWRLVLSKGASQIYGLMLRNKLASYTACFRVYRRSAVLGMKLDNHGFTGIAEILARLDQSGARILECPAVLESRLLGVSKMKVARTIGEHARLMTKLVRGRLATPQVDREKLSAAPAERHNG